MADDERNGGGPFAAVDLGSNSFHMVIGRVLGNELSVLDRLRDQAATWGFAINTRYGEPFACREPIGLTAMRGLI